MNKDKIDKSQKIYLTVNCAECAERVRAEVLGSYEFEYFEPSILMTLPDYRTTFVLCPSGHPILVRENFEGEDDLALPIWSPPVRLWPQTEREINMQIPDIVRISMDEANKCYRAAAYTASAVMCGRALEGICKYFQMKATLVKGLKELLDKNIIDQRLFEWSEQLRLHRNLAAHATGEKISKEDATDLLDFLNAICEYVFVLTPKFKSFMERKTKK